MLPFFTCELMRWILVCFVRTVTTRAVPQTRTETRTSARWSSTQGITVQRAAARAGRGSHRRRAATVRCLCECQSPVSSGPRSCSAALCLDSAVTSWDDVWLSLLSRHCTLLSLSSGELSAAADLGQTLTGRRNMEERAVRPGQGRPPCSQIALRYYSRSTDCFNEKMWTLSDFLDCILLLRVSLEPSTC